jgi:hypothetical protein
MHRPRASGKHDATAIGHHPQRETSAQFTMILGIIPNICLPYYLRQSLNILIQLHFICGPALGTIPA